MWRANACPCGSLPRWPAGRCRVGRGRLWSPLESRPCTVASLPLFLVFVVVPSGTPVGANVSPAKDWGCRAAVLGSSHLYSCLLLCGPDASLELVL